MLGHHVVFRYSETWVGYALFAGRVIMGFILLVAGLDKLFDPGWTAAGYLQNAVHAANPLREMFVSMAGSAAVDQLVIWGLTLTGLGLLLGAAVRWCAFWAALLMLLFWASALQGGLLQGLPLENGYVVDDHIVYAVLLFALGAFGAGRVVGVDARLERTSVVKRNPWLRYVLG